LPVRKEAKGFERRVAFCAIDLLVQKKKKARNAPDQLRRRKNGRVAAKREALTRFSKA